MSFDKAKHTRNAERFLSQGKIRAAIGEYKRIVENDPKDFSTLNLLGDLCVKAQDTSEAVKYYTQVAEHYAKQGFAQKAIAIYNKIARLTPDSIDVSAKLAQLYQSKGSVAEARTHYVSLAEHFQKRGQKAEALAIWKQIAELDPNNTEIYLKIAEMCKAEDQSDEAVNAYVEAGARFIAKKQFAVAATAFTKALEIEPNHLPALNGLVNAQIGLGYADEAAATLEDMLEKQPYNREILNLLVNCYIDIDKSSEAEKAVIKLVEQEPANYPVFLDVARSYLKNNDLASAARILSITSEHLLVGGQAEELGHWINEILAKNPEQLEALRLLVRYHGWQRDESELKSSLERMAEAARINEAVDDERYALSQLMLMIPHEASYPQRLQEINELYGYAETHFDESLIAPQTAETADVVPTFESFAANENESDGIGVATEMYFEDYAEFKADDNYNDGFDYEKLYQNGSSNGSSNGYAFKTDENAPLVVTDFDISGGDFQTVSAAEIVEEIPAEAIVKPEPKSVDYAKLHEELETVEYYFAQGYKDLALKTLDSIADNFGNLPEIEELRRQITSGDERTDEVIQTATVTETISAPALSPDVQNFDIISEFRDELGFEEADPSLPEGDYDTHYQMGIAYQEMGLMEDAIREYQDAIQLVSPNDGTRRFFYCCNLLGHCFMVKEMPNIALMWYQRGIETSGLNEKELQGLRYEIANAYAAGGETEKAVDYFEQIYAVDVEYRDVSERLNQLHARG